MNRRLWPFAVIYLIGAVLAFWAVRPGSVDQALEEGAIWSRIPRADIKFIHYSGDGMTVKMEPLHESLAWIDWKKDKDNVKEEKRFLANDEESLRNIWHDLNPVWAQKKIGKAKDLKLEDYGLDKDTAEFKVELKDGKVITYTVGKRSFQSKSAFILDPANSEIFLWDLEVIGLLASAPKNLAIEIPMAFGTKVLGSVIVTKGKEERAEWYFRGGKWKQDEVIEDPDFLPWFQKLQNIQVEGYPSKEQADALDKTEPLTVVYVEEKGGGGKQYALQIIPESTKDGTAYWLKDVRYPSLLKLETKKLKLLIDELDTLMKDVDSRKVKK